MLKLRPVLARNHGCCTLHYSNIVPLLPVTMAATAIHDIFFCLWDVLFAATGFRKNFIRRSKKNIVALLNLLHLLNACVHGFPTMKIRFFLLYSLLKKYPCRSCIGCSTISIFICCCANCAGNWLVILAVGRVARMHKSLIYNI